jgi:hypothetical protein
VRLHRLHSHAVSLGLDVIYSDLGDRYGVYYAEAHLIMLHRAMTRPQVTAALAHELGHAIRGDRCSTPWAEDRADEIGASLAITADEYALAVCHAGRGTDSIAAALEVTPRLVAAWRRWWAWQTAGARPA